MKGLQAALCCQWVCCDQAEFPRDHQQEDGISNVAIEALSDNIAALLQSRCASRGIVAEPWSERLMPCQRGVNPTKMWQKAKQQERKSRYKAARRRKQAA